MPLSIAEVNYLLLLAALSCRSRYSPSELHRMEGMEEWVSHCLQRLNLGTPHVLACIGLSFIYTLP
jgi:hypothetical protein